MSQDIALALEQAKLALKVIPLEGAAQRATTFEVRFDGGSFTFHVYEVRESTEPRVITSLVSWQLHEIARFAISPVAFSRLRDAMTSGESMYTAVMGRPVLTEAENNQNTINFVQSTVVGPAAAPKKKQQL